MVGSCASAPDPFTRLIASLTGGAIAATTCKDAEDVVAIGSVCWRSGRRGGCRRNMLAFRPLQVFRAAGLRSNLSSALPRLPDGVVDFKFVRSQGPGGQSVNKVSTRAEARLDLRRAAFIPNDVRERLETQEASRINKLGELVVVAQEHRSQLRNKAACLTRLEEMLDQAWEPPLERKFKAGLTVDAKTRRKEARRQRGQTKARRQVGRDDY